MVWERDLHTQGMWQQSTQTNSLIFVSLIAYTSKLLNIRNWVMAARMVWAVLSQMERRFPNTNLKLEVVLLTADVQLHMMTIDCSIQWQNISGLISKNLPCQNQLRNRWEFISDLALFPGPAQFFVAIGTESNGKLGGAWERGYFRSTTYTFAVRLFVADFNHLAGNSHSNTL